MHKCILKDGHMLDDRTALSIPDICQLTDLCLRSTYFVFEDQFFEQIAGAAMGSPLSPVVTNLYKEQLEKQALTTSRIVPDLWIRYVDDTFVTWAHSEGRLNKF